MYVYRERERETNSAAQKDPGLCAGRGPVHERGRLPGDQGLDTCIYIYIYIYVVIY